MKYTDISRAHRALKKLEDQHPVGGGHYWTAYEAFKVQLRHALRDDELLRKLTKPQLFQVIAWCSTFRPHEPHVMLTIFSKLAD